MITKNRPLGRFSRHFVNWLRLARACRSAWGFSVLFCGFFEWCCQFGTRITTSLSVFASIFSKEGGWIPVYQQTTGITTVVNTLLPESYLVE